MLIGGGGHCRSCIDVIEATNLYEIIGIVEKTTAPKNDEWRYPIIGSDADLPDLLKITRLVLITIGQIHSSEKRSALYERLLKLGAVFPIITSPMAYISKNAVIEQGSIIMHGALINSGAKIGKNCIINSHALVEHGTKIEDNCHISTGSKVNGDVFVGEGTFVGSGAIIHHGIRIGKNSSITAGAIVSHNLSNSSKYRG